MTSNHIRSIAIVGGTGQIGKTLLPELLETGRFNVTAVSRSDSKAEFPSNVKVVRGDYGDSAYLERAFKDADALIIALGHTAPHDLQPHMIDAATKVGVPFIIPSDFGSDGAHPHMGDGLPVNKPKGEIRKRIADKSLDGKTKWISIVNNPWYDFSYKVGAFGINPLTRTATLYDKGTTKFNTSTWHLVGRAVASLLSLPITSSDGSPSLSDYGNKFVYISSFHISQRDILEATQKATSTTDADWKIEEKSAQAWLDEGFERLGKGDHSAVVPVVYGSHFKEGLGGSFEGVKGKEKFNDIVKGTELELPTENLVEVTKRLIGEMESSQK